MIDAAALAITQFGVPLMVALVGLQWWLGKPRLQVRHACISAGVAFCLGLAAAQVLLLYYHRLRPYDAGVSHLILPPTVDWSFPSDHAIASSAIAMSWQMLRRDALAWLFVAMTFLICLSRVYVGMHYVSDVLGGLLFAMAAVLAVKAVYKPNSKLDQWLTSWF